MATLVTLALALLKFIVGFTFDSSVLIADAVHSSADILAIFASGFGLWLASRKRADGSRTVCTKRKRSPVFSSAFSYYGRA